MARKALINLLLLLLPLVTFFSGGHPSVMFNYDNQCSYSVWHGATSAIGEAMYEFSPYTLTLFETPDVWTGSIYFRTGCALNNVTLKIECETGDCGSGEFSCDGVPPGSPVTFLHFSINQSEVIYGVSVVHGWNVGMSIEPDGGTGACDPVDCRRDLTNVCPLPLLYRNKHGRTVACYGACDALKDPVYCCTGNYSSPEACKPNSYSELFKQSCPLAHTYLRDCDPPFYKCTGAKKYTITICPSPY